MDVQEDFSNQTAVSQYLIKCFQSVIKSNSVSRTELVLKMITTNLTFDDPGMFVKSVIRNEKDQLIQDTTVLWLINQVIYVANKPEFYRSMEIITDLQKNIISASFMKQPLFFNKLIMNYIEFTNELSNADFKFTKPLTISLFQVKDFDIGSIVLNCTYKPIEIRSLQSLNSLQHTNIRLLSHAVTQMTRFENDLMVKCTRCVLTAFESMDLNIKTICLNYFIKLFCHITEMNAELQSIFIAILNHIADIERRLALWLQHKTIKNEDVVAYVQSTVELLENPHITTLLQETSLIDASHSCFTILNVHHNEKVAMCDQIMVSVYKFLKSAFSIVNDAQLFANLRALLEKHENNNAIYGQTIALLESVAIHEIKENELQSWQKVNQKIQNLLDQNDAAQYTHTVLDQIKCFRAIFETARKIEHNITIHQQQKYCKAPTTSSDLKNMSSHLITLNAKNLDCGDKKLFTNLDTIISKILKKFQSFISSNCPLSDTMLLLISETSIELLGLSDCHEIDDYLQLQLLLFALSPLLRYSELLYNHFQQAFETIFDRVNKILETASAVKQSWRTSALELITKLNLEFLSIKNRDILMDFVMQIFSCMKETEYQKLIMEISIGLIIQDSFRLEIYENFLRSKMDDPKNHLAISEKLRSFLCLSSGSCYIFLTNKNDVYRYKILCKNCDLNLKQKQGEMELTESDLFINLLMKTNGKFVLSPKITYKFDANCSNRYFGLFNSADTQIRTNMTECIPALLNHLSSFSFQSQNVDHWLDPMMDDHIEIRLSMCQHINVIPYLIQNSSFSAARKQELIEKCLKKLLDCVKKFLTSGREPDQSCALNFILAFATSEVVTEETLLHCFRMTLYFCICSKSVVSRKASLCATEMCRRFGLTTSKMLKWHKTNLFKFMIQLCVSNFITYNIGLEKSLYSIYQMFGYRDLKQEFIVEHYGTILAMLIPMSIKYEKCMELIEEVCDIVQKDLATAISSSFLSIYIHLYLNNSTEENSKCMDFIIQNTGSSLYLLLKSDVKKTIAEILIYYHFKPEFVMNTFRNFLNENYEGGYSQTDLTTKILAEYITPRFLGVMCYFEQILILDNEKFLKREVLLSLGEIMRFMGSEHITQFRFKLLAVLRAALNLKELRDICAKVWKTFILTVDLISLGPLLSTIFVSLEPLLATHPEEVNDMLKYLVISNGSLLSVYIPDLFFVNDLNVSNEIKTYVLKYTERTNETFMDKFGAMIKHINHDNLTVRIYGLNYLTALFKGNRKNLNQLIIRQRKMHPIVENLLDNLMICIKSHDESLQIATGQCLGQLGALEPSLLSPNYGPQESFARDINTDEFAIMALAELCKGYQFQKDTKNVDTYSLAIQEILLAREVCPKLKKNMKVWEAIPERMRPLMEPLLTSCYTMPNSRGKITVHPIFGSYKCRTYEEWAITWAIKTIEVITDESIKNLLRSFKPCLKYDIRMLSVFLPYIIIHALQLSDLEDRQSIAQEIYAVFAAVINPSDKCDDNGKKKYRSIKGPDFVPLTSDAAELKKDESIDIGIKCAKLAFSQLDFIDRWLRTTKPTDTSNHTTVKNFLQQFDKKMIASANFASGEYARALMYLESYIEEDRSARLQPELSFLSQIYAELMDPDSLEGALNMKNTEPTLTEQIMKNNAQGRLQESVVCFERLMHENGLSENNAIEMIQCYLGLDQPETAILLAEGLMKQLYDQNADALVQSSAEPLWRLGRFEELSDLIESSNMQDSANWGIRCGQILLNFRQDNDIAFTNEIDKSRLVVLKSLRIVGDEQNSYQKGYTNVMKLHLISEIEQARNVVNVISNGKTDNISETITNLLDDWDGRLESLQPSARVIEPVLCLRRIVLKEVKNALGRELKNKNLFTLIETQLNNYIGASWIKSTELARNEGMLQQADLYILNAEPFKPLNLFIEKAKMFWKKGDQANSFKVLERGIEEINSLNLVRDVNSAERQVLGEAKFLSAFYNAESLNINTHLNIRYFKSATKALSESEKCLVHYAQYLDKTLPTLPTGTVEQQQKAYECQLEIIYFYCKSMGYGTKYIYQSMPRVLTIWLDFTADVTKKDEPYRKYCGKMNNFITQFAENLPKFTFFTAFSQLVSRICHPSTDVYNILKTVIIKLILAFPQQSMWMILSVYKSSYANRVRRCTEIFSDKRLSSKSVQKLIQDFNSLAEKMIELTNKELPSKPQKFLIDMIYPQFPNILSRNGFSQILLPIEKFMQPVLPSMGKHDEPLQTFNVFPNKAVYIAGVRNELTVFASLQRPRRITLIGSDGKDYIILMKAKDDLRKDYRLMEFNNVVKQFLHENSEARQRRLNIRTYAVMPLNEDCGIIEWVSNLQAFRIIVNGYYKQKNLGVSSKEIKEGQALAKDSTEKRREWFRKVLAKHPPIFSDWFRERFTTPHNWYQARSSYIRTTAVMSIVGYILGLGDRHGENILFDAANGDIVHVDFNCLFNKGELFEIPEVVPFRLTHNMVHAMGPLGVEGLYRKCCEITLRVLQEQTPTLMSILRPFVYDPLVSWSRHGKNDGRSERTDPQAMANVQHIEERLKGFVKINGTNSNMPLSIEGVVNHCIIEATDIDKLCRMYVGWGGYL